MTMKAKFFLGNVAQSYFKRQCTTNAKETAIMPLGKKARKLLVEGLSQKSILNVEKNTQILITEVCGTNLLANEGENIKIKDDSYYPDWLWNIHLGPAKTLEEMDPTSKEYWTLVKHLALEKEKHLDTLVPHRTVHK